MSWVERHFCELPFKVHNKPELGDVWECDHCKTQWAVNYIKSTRSDGYDRFELAFILLPRFGLVQ